MVLVFVTMWFVKAQPGCTWAVFHKWKNFYLVFRFREVQTAAMPSVLRNFRCPCDFSVFFDGRIYCSSAGMLAVWGSADWITGGKPAEGVAQVDGILSIVRGYKMEVGAFS